MIQLPINTYLSNETLSKKITNCKSKAKSLVQFQQENLNSLTTKHKQQIRKIIAKDQAKKIAQKIQQNTITLFHDISMKQHRWNIVHYAIKCDSVQILEYALKKVFQSDSDKYIKLVNSKTQQGYTPIMIAIIYKSKLSLQLLLKSGGVDLLIIDTKKQTLYQLASQYNNDNCIKKLSQYEQANKNSEYLNIQYLNQPIVFPKNVSIFEKMLNFCNCCLPVSIVSSFKGGQSVQKDEQFKLIHGLQIDVKDIQWKKQQQPIENQFKLYNCFPTQGILQNVIIINNFNIIFRALSQQSKIIKKLIKQEKKIYSIKLYSDNAQIKTTNRLPFLKSSTQQLFLQSQGELWPQLLLKALAIKYNSYLKLTTLNIEQIIYQLTGGMCLVHSINKMDKFKNIFQSSQFKYISLFKISQKSIFKNTKYTDQYVFFKKKIVLASVEYFMLEFPFIIQENQLSKKYHCKPAQKIQKNNQNQIWLSKQQLQENCDHALSILASESFHKYKYHFISHSNIVYLKLAISGSKRMLPAYISIINKRTLQYVNLLKAIGWQNDGQYETELQIEQNYAYLKNTKGSYLFQLTLDNFLASEQLILLCESELTVTLEVLDNSIGELECIEALKLQIANNSSRITEKMKVITLDKNVLIFVKSFKKTCVLRMNICKNHILEGEYIQESRVKLIRLNDTEFFYTVLQTCLEQPPIIQEYENDNQ